MHTLQGEKGRSGWEAGGSQDHLHVEQLGRLVHADRNGALTPSLAEHFLQGIAHRVHPADQQGESRSAGSSRLAAEGSSSHRVRRHTYLSVFCSAAENSSKVILQVRVPHAARAAPAPPVRGAPTLSLPTLPARLPPASSLVLRGSAAQPPAGYWRTKGRIPELRD